jgi:hypothetical protein
MQLTLSVSPVSIHQIFCDRLRMEIGNFWTPKAVKRQINPSKFQRFIINSPNDISVSHQTETYAEPEDSLILIFKIPAPYSPAGYYFWN